VFGGGYTLIYTKQLLSQQYVVSGSVDVTNVNGNAQLTISSINLVVAGQTFNPPCKTLPGRAYVMAPAEVLSCPFNLTISTTPLLTSSSLSGYVQTNIGRRALDTPVPFSFAACIPSQIPTQQAAAAGAKQPTAAAAQPPGSAAAPGSRRRLHCQGSRRLCQCH